MYTVTPLINTFSEIKYQQQAIQNNTLANEYPALDTFLNSLGGLKSTATKELLFVLEFLHIMGRKSDGTFLRFRNEAERLCLFCWQVREKGIFDVGRKDIEAYIDFVWQPNKQWIGLSVQQRFIEHAGIFKSNPNWRPFVAKVAKSLSKKDPNRVANVDDYRPSQESLTSTFTAISVLYKHAQMEEVCDKNYVPVVKRSCPFLIKQVQRKTPDTLSQLQWEYVLGVTRDHADKDAKFERNLFIIATLKSLYLRVSELSEHSKWQPKMSHFTKDNDNFWYLTVFGKGNKIRDVTVPPAYISYLQRYRKYRGLIGLPSPDEDTPMLNKLRGSGNMTARQIRRIVEQSFDLAITALNNDGFDDDANYLMAATTHWLRHTGATEDAGTRPLKHLADELGHASSETTDKNYIQTNIKDRAMSGQDRKV
ncbi:site-specific integrase [Psychrobium sp. 1_MG-2023]|uniref:tyrosine-type recombinase/integrase n=1 Tax=Psychrobium sp. 1_MG-2023 TaxID=3062624 RepID=UPI000C32BDA9|nr:site-specific integrase [Psychrobium sp. 1_MG-2023]MDP2561581.1 site-specific integrase [Psychrobium sp. 1_MG-2023]PKF55041.1 integrase [Alteromonadales bacterium alter-6D02]